MNVNQKKIIQNRIYYANRLKIILQYLNLKQATILDLGCGEMILYDLVKNQINNYIGVDCIPFSDSKLFVEGDISDKSLLQNHSADFVFLLGVLDHISFNEKQSALENCKVKFNNELIISQRNPNSLINYFHKNDSPVIEIEKYFENYKIKKLFLLKLPFTGIVFDLSKRKNWIKKLCTEIIYIINKEPLSS